MAMEGGNGCLPACQRGFTLVELIMTMVIIGILAAVAAPRFFDNNAIQVRGFADQVQASLRYAQKTAIAQHRFVCVAFASNSITLTYDPTAPSVAHTAMTACPGGSPLQCPSGLATTTTTMTVCPGSPPGDYSISSSSASFSATPAAFYFDALGKPSFAANQTVQVQDAFAINIEAETGYVH